MVACLVGLLFGLSTFLVSFKDNFSFQVIRWYQPINNNLCISIIIISSSTDISDPLSPPLPIVDCFWQVFRATSSIGTELLYVGSVMFWPSTRPKKMLFQGDAPEGSDTFQWPVIERDRVGGLRLIIWDKVKVPLCQYRLMHRKRVTSELHDSYFRLMTIKHSISKIQWAIVWALNYYLTQLSSSPRAVACRIPDS